MSENTFRITVSIALVVLALATAAQTLYLYNPPVLQLGPAPAEMGKPIEVTPYYKAEPKEPAQSDLKNPMGPEPPAK